MSSHSSGPSRSARRAAAGVRVIAALTAGTATAAQADTSADTSVANVAVTNAILLSGLTPAFTLTGIPGAVVTGAAAVAMTVSTNNLAGYAVTVQAAGPALVPAVPATNPDSIPIGNLGVREGPTGAFTALSNTNPVTVHSQGTRSALGGDALTNDYQVLIPFVNTGTYSVTLNYIATEL